MNLFKNLDEKNIDLDKLLAAVHIDTFRKNKFVNKETEVPPGTKLRSTLLFPLVMALLLADFQPEMDISLIKPPMVV